MSVAKGSPTKDFFVDILTKDIHLNDAILDLLDNCLDGVVRIKGSQNKWEDKEYYKGYCAEINITNDSFSIKDNCGGIPREVAEEYAFRMGRTPTTGSNLPTVGIYGIGMKRAIFKMGKDALIETKNDSKIYSVHISEDWSLSTDWDFPIEDLASNDELVDEGTIVTIIKLNSEISSLWSSAERIENFVENLNVAIKQSYSLIIQKGFCIKINGTAIEALPIELLISTSESGIKPYIFKKTFGDVNVQLAIGFYAPPPSEEDIDDGNELKRSSADAGWTIVCNDRVVLYNDKTYLSGWGEAGVPSYHTQFIGIRGIVTFESNNPQELPMTTTKRGINLSSPIYAAVKDRMREGLKLFINYTNIWKGRIQMERSQHSTKTERVPFAKILENNTEFQASHGLKFASSSGGMIFKPVLPKPPSDKNYRIIRYTKPTEDIKILSEYFFNDESLEISASIIGEKCFDTVFELACKKLRGSSCE